jgi:phosphatidylglycerophosphatase A
VHRLVASSFGLGFIPRRLWGSDAGAGTFGAALAAVISVVLWSAEIWVQALVAVAFIGLSLWSAVPFATGGQDPNWVVMDETGGTLLALIGLTGWPWLAALVVARLSDITKWPPGVAASEGLPGSLGVTADDAVAGIYGLGVGLLLTALT